MPTQFPFDFAYMTKTEPSKTLYQPSIPAQKKKKKRGKSSCFETIVLSMHTTLLKQCHPNSAFVFHTWAWPYFPLRILGNSQSIC